MSTKNKNCTSFAFILSTQLWDRINTGETDCRKKLIHQASHGYFFKGQFTRLVLGYYLECGFQDFYCSLISLEHCI